MREVRCASAGLMSGAFRLSAAQSLRFPAHTPGGAAFGGAVPHMRSLKLSRRGTPISATERAEKSWSLVLAVRSAEDVMTVVTSGRFPSIGHLTELLSKRAVERGSNVTPTTDQIEGEQHGTEAKQTGSEAGRERVCQEGEN